MAEWIRHQTSDLGIAGSSPVTVGSFCLSKWFLPNLIVVALLNLKDVKENQPRQQLGVRLLPGLGSLLRDRLSLSLMDGGFWKSPFLFYLKIGCFIALFYGLFSSVDTTNRMDLYVKPWVGDPLLQQKNDLWPSHILSNATQRTPFRQVFHHNR